VQCLPNRRPSKKPPEPHCPPSAAIRRKKDLKGASKDMADPMSEKELEELAATKRNSLPNKKG
jgi:Protein of unknwon function (DUF3008)